MKKNPDSPLSTEDKEQQYRIIFESASDGMIITDIETGRVVDANPANQLPAPGLGLTEREREVLTLMIEGLNNTQIAGRLTVSPSTIKSHVSNILSKLGVASRTEAVTLALRNGIVPPW